MSSILSGRRIVISVSFLLLSAIGLYGLLPQIDNFSQSWHAVKSAHIDLLLLAASSSLLATVTAGILYRTLAIRTVKTGDAIAVQFAGLLINRILPTGIGGLGLNYLFLRSRQHRNIEATAVVALNGSLGFIGHLLVTASILVVAIGSGLDVPSVDLPWLLLLGVLVALMLVAGVVFYNRHAIEAKYGLKKHVRMLRRTYRRQPLRLVLGLVLSCILTFSNASCFYLCCQALGVSSGFVACFLIFSVGVIATTATPTPGGIGGAEAALAGGLVAAGTGATQALAAALLYRLVSFWFGLLLGALTCVYLMLRRRVRLASPLLFVKPKGHPKRRG